jgi:hypothetical protein
LQPWCKALKNYKNWFKFLNSSPNTKANVKHFGYHVTRNTSIKYERSPSLGVEAISHVFATDITDTQMDRQDKAAKSLIPQAYKKYKISITFSVILYLFCQLSFLERKSYCTIFFHNTK